MDFYTNGHLSIWIFAPGTFLAWPWVNSTYPWVSVFMGFYIHLHLFIWAFGHIYFCPWFFVFWAFVYMGFCPIDFNTHGHLCIWVFAHGIFLAWHVNGIFHGFLFLSDLIWKCICPFGYLYTSAFVHGFVFSGLLYIWAFVHRLLFSRPLSNVLLYKQTFVYMGFCSWNFFSMALRK